MNWRVSRVVAAVLFLGCGRSEFDLPNVPLPVLAENIKQASFQPDHLERSFLVSSVEEMEEVRQYYIGWAVRHQWRKLDKSEESWSGDEWFTFIDRDGSQMESRLIHWADRRGEWSLRLVFRQNHSKGEKLVVVIVSRFQNLDHAETAV